MLLGNREERWFKEDVGKVLIKLVNPFLHGSLRKYRSIQADTVARAMIQFAKESKPGIHVIESDEIQGTGELVSW